MQETIYAFGKKRASDDSIKKSRKIFNLGTFIDGDLIENAKFLLNERYNISLINFDMEIIQRENKIGFYQNWHIDDCAVFKHKDTQNKTNNIPLNDKYSLYHSKPLPTYTMIIYLTSHGTDFIGGEFEFVDQIIKPRKHDVVFFDSKEVHKVNTLRSGIRKNILIKFFDKNI